MKQDWFGVGGLNVEWFGDDVLEAANKACVKVSADVADLVEADAKRILRQKAKHTTVGGLLDQFTIDDLKDGTKLVWCQGPRKWSKPYHASFVELGTYKDTAKSFMRPAYKLHQRSAKKLYQKTLDEL